MRSVSVHLLKPQLQAMSLNFKQPTDSGSMTEIGMRRLLVRIKTRKEKPLFIFFKKRAFSRSDWLLR